jgi:hypothetical protein
VALSGHACVVYDEKMWVIGGSTASGYSKKVYYTTNGSTWTEAGTDALPLPLAAFSSLVYDEKMWVIGGYDGTASPGDDYYRQKIYYTTNGITWTEAGTDALPVGVGSHASVVFLGKMWIIGGIFGWSTAAENSQKVFYSTLSGGTRLYKQCYGTKVSGTDLTELEGRVLNNKQLLNTCFLVDSEAMKVNRVFFEYPTNEYGGLIFSDAVSFTCSERGARGTTAATHNISSIVTVISPTSIEVRDKGVPLEIMTSTENAPSPGEAEYDYTNGRIYLASNPVGRISMDAVGENFDAVKYAYWHRIAEQLVLKHTSLTASDIHAGSLTWLDTYGNHEAGIYIPQTSRLRDILDMLIAPFLGWFGMNRDRKLMIRKINAWKDSGWKDSGNITSWIVTNDMIQDIEKVPAPLYCNKINFAFNKNWTPQSEDELADSLYPVEKDRYIRGSQNFPKDVSTTQYGSEKTIESMLVGDDAAGESDPPGLVGNEWLQQWADKEMLKLTMKHYTFLVSLGDQMTVSSTALGYVARDYQVIRIQETPQVVRGRITHKNQYLLLSI